VTPWTKERYQSLDRWFWTEADWAFIGNGVRDALARALNAVREGGELIDIARGVLERWLSELPVPASRQIAATNVRSLLAAIPQRSDAERRARLFTPSRFSRVRPGSDLCALCGQGVGHHYSLLSEQRCRPIDADVPAVDLQAAATLGRIPALLRVVLWRIAAESSSLASLVCDINAAVRRRDPRVSFQEGGCLMSAKPSGTRMAKAPEIMRVPEVVALLGVDRKTVYDAVTRNEIPHRWIGAGRGDGRGGVILFLRSAIMRWLSGIDEYPQRKVAMFGNYVTKRAQEFGIPVIEARVPVHITVTPRDVASAMKKSSKQCPLARASARLPEVQAGHFFRTTAYLEYRDKMVRYSLPTSIQKEIVSFDRARMFAPGAYQLSPTATPTRQARALLKDKAGARRNIRIGAKAGKRQPTRKPAVVHRTQHIRRVGASQ
jgi:hypothetical protein